LPFCPTSNLSTVLRSPLRSRRCGATALRIYLWTDADQVFLARLWLTPTYKSFVTALTLCGYTSYMFGWHVHEKAILLVLVPLRWVGHLPWTVTVVLTRGTQPCSSRRSHVLPDVCHCKRRRRVLLVSASVHACRYVVLSQVHALFSSDRFLESLVKLVYSVLWAFFTFTPLNKIVYR
jgi:hypothetical protein